MDRMAPFSKSSRMARNDRLWNGHKEAIRRTYLKENNTLEFTMERIEEAHGFRASKRKWKEKLKEWNFDKNLSSENMKIIVAKGDKRAREEGKETVFFFHKDIPITEERIEGFKKRKIVKEEDSASPSAAETPANITYHTPCPEMTPPSDTNTKEKDELESQTESRHSSNTSFQPLLRKHRTTTAIGVLNAQATYKKALENSGDPAEDTEVPCTTNTEFDDSSTTPSISSIIQATGLNASRPKSQLVTTTVTEHQVVPIDDETLSCKSDRELDQVASHYLEVSAKPEGIDSLNALSILSLIAKEYQSRKRDNIAEYLPMLADMYRRIIAGQEHFFGASCLPSLQPTVELAKILRRSSKFTEAETLLRKATVGYELSANEDAKLECQCLLGQILSQMGNEREANKWLVGVAAKCLQRGSSTQMTGAIRSLLKNYRPTEDLWFLIDKMYTILGKWNLRQEVNSAYCPELWFQAVRLASAYSRSTDGSDCACLLFSSVFLQIGRLSNTTYWKDKSRAYMEYALHSQRYKKWGECLSHLGLAVKAASSVKDGHNLVVTSQPKLALGRLNNEFWACDGIAVTALFNQHLPKISLFLECSLGYEDSPSDFIVSQNFIVSQSALTERWENEGDLPWAPNSISIAQRDARSFGDPSFFNTGGLASSHGMSSMSSRSNIYGVTYSAPSIAGISDSIFMVP